jgi:hypothetical protein
MDDWRIVDLARRDGPSGLICAEALPLLAARFFGLAHPQPLANERMEALRLFSARAWYRGTIRIEDFDRLFAAGFSQEQAEEVLNHVGRVRSSDRPPARRAA